MPEEMGIQHKQRSTLQELLKSQPGGKAAKNRLPTPPPPLLVRVDFTDHKRKRDQKGKEVVETGRTDPSQEDEPQRGAKQP